MWVYDWVKDWVKDWVEDWVQYWLFKCEVSPEAMQARIQQARREAETPRTRSRGRRTSLRI